MTDRIRLGKYLKSSLVAGDFIILNIAYFCTLWITHFDYLFASKWVWLIVNISLVPSLLLYSDIHNHRIDFCRPCNAICFQSNSCSGYGNEFFCLYV